MPTPGTEDLPRPTLLHGMSAVTTLRDEWEALAARTGAPISCRPSWLVVWQRHLAPEAVPEVLVVRDGDGSLAGVLPLARMSRRLHARVPLSVRYLAIAGAGIGSADHNGPVAVDDHVATALFGAAVELARTTSSTLYLENLAPRWADLARQVTGGTVTRLTECPAAHRPPDGHFAAAWSAKMAKNIRRRQRLLDGERITARWVPTGDGFDTALHELRRVHEGRWNAQGGAGMLGDERLALLGDLAVECRSPDVPSLLLLEREDRVVAALFGIRTGTSFSVRKTGWDPAYAHLGLGIMLGVHAMRRAEEQGLTTFDYLRGPRGHKRDLGCEPAFDVSIIRPAGLGGLLLEHRERFAEDGVRPGWWNRLTPAVGRARRTVPAGVRRLRAVRGQRPRATHS